MTIYTDFLRKEKTEHYKLLDVNGTIYASSFMISHWQNGTAKR